MIVNALTAWQGNMTTVGALQAARLAAALTSDLNQAYYDGARVFDQIATYTGSDIWLAPLKDCIRIYRDGYVLPNNGQVNGYTKFTYGLRRHFERTGDPLSKQAVLLIAENGAYSNDVPLDWTVATDRAREVAYTIQAYIDAQALGATPRQRRTDLVNQAYGHILQWVGGTAVESQPFMMGLTAFALIRDWQQTGDPRLVPALTTLADFLWPKYPWPVDLASPGTPAPDLNLLIAPIYAFLLWKTGSVARGDQFNRVFTDGVTLAYLGDGKHFDQNYVYSFEAVQWTSTAILVVPPPPTSTAFSLQIVDPTGRVIGSIPLS